MRIVFCGTPAFAVPALAALHAAEHEIVAAFTQPDRPAGRGRQLHRAAVAQCAERLAVPVHQPLKLDAAAQALLRQLAPQVIVVVAYGLILPQAVLDIPPLGCINIHASLLPRWRGAAPIARAIEAGDRHTGVTLMKMDAGLDTGPMLCGETWEISADTTAAQLHDALAMLGARLIAHHLPQYAAGALEAQPQPDHGATYARKLGKEEARIDWSRGASEIARRIRAFNPAPVAWSLLGDERLRLWDARAGRAAADGAPDAAPHAAPGTVIALDAQGLEVAAADGTVLVRQMQRPGGRVLTAPEFAAAQGFVGQRFAG